MLDRCLATQASYDVVVVGGGIVGLGTARELIIRHPTLKFAVVEKENELCEYKDGHLLLLELFLHEGSVAYSLKFGCNDTVKGNSSNNNHNHNHNHNHHHHPPPPPPNNNNNNNDNNNNTLKSRLNGCGDESHNKSISYFIS